MFSGKYTYGFLTTYNHTIFLKQQILTPNLARAYGISKYFAIYHTTVSMLRHIVCREK